MWSAIQWVTGGVTLAAFLAAAAAAAYRSKLSHDVKILQSAPESERGQLLLAKWGAFHIDTESLTKNQKYDLAIQQIRSKGRQFNAVIIVVVLIALILAGVTVYAIAKGSDGRVEKLKGQLEEKNQEIARVNTLANKLASSGQERIKYVLVIMTQEQVSETLLAKYNENGKEFTATRQELEAQLARVEHLVTPEAPITVRRSVEQAKEVLRDAKSLNASAEIIWFNKFFHKTFWWGFNGTNYVNAGEFKGIEPLGYNLTAVGDFDRDGRTDFLLRSTNTGQNAVWFTTNKVFKSAHMIPSVDIDYYVVGTGDFNRDGISDILWHHTALDMTVVWFMNSTGPTNYSFNEVIGWCPKMTNTSWRASATGDFNNDGNTDIVWRNKGTGQNIVWLMNGTNRVSSVSIATQSDTNFQIVATGHFNREGYTDIVWRHQTSGINSIWLMGGVDGLTLLSTCSIPPVADQNWVVVGVAEHTNPKALDARIDLQGPAQRKVDLNLAFNLRLIDLTEEK